MRTTVLLALCLVASLQGRAAAQEFRWAPGEPSFPRVSAAEWVVGGVTFTAGMAMFLFWDPSAPRWRGPILFDGAVRDLLRVEDDDTRHVLTGVSDVNFYMLMFLPTALDAGLVVAGLHGKPDVAGQMLGMNLLAYGVASTLAYGISAGIARERPFAQPCLEDPDYDSGCLDAGSRNTSFFSGHAAAAFTGAGVTCAHHQFLPIYGGGWDTAACVVALSMASTVSILRIATDNHYASDILVGTGLGFGLGYGLPALLHYQHGRLPANVTLFPRFGRDSYALYLRVVD